MSQANQIIYRQLLQRHGRIQIPMIQRDYAQGRPSESTVRDVFLMALEEALHKPVDDPTLPLNLDFIYGSVEGEDESRFLPLDGQQRLTTLFLLHWYLAWQDSDWAEFEEMFVKDGHARFTYDVRSSAVEFFDQLVCYRPAVLPKDIPSVDNPITAHITDQPWYFRSWRLDPSIQAVLHMLDAIHNRFAATEGLFARLIDETHPVITFQLLDLENFGLSDDLYIKMNARGRPLTPFETFKARYEEVLKRQANGETFTVAGHDVDAAEYVSRRMDTAWTDLFWRLRDKTSHLFDDAFMNIFWAVALITRNPGDENYVDNVSILRDAPSAPLFVEFQTHSWLDERFTRTMIRLLDSWCKGNEGLRRLLLNARYFDEDAFFNRVARIGAKITFTEVVQFAGYATFIAEYHSDIKEEAFQEWMRIIHNLAVNTVYNREADLQRSIRGINELLANARDILVHFTETETPASGFSEPQIAEEKLKAELIVAHAGWRALIDRAEGHGYFRGQIGFLLDFCSARDAASELAPRSWDTTQHVDLQQRFLHYLGLAEKMFDANGLVDVGNYRWQRALLSIGDYFLPRDRNWSFLVNSATDESSWKRLLRGIGPKVPESRSYLHQLWDRLALDDDLVQQLDRIIDDAECPEPWRATMVHFPAVFVYCGKNYIRREDSIYLLKLSQLNGRHAELFTYCLFQELLTKSFFALVPSYESVTDTYSEPHITLGCTLAGGSVRFDVLYKHGEYLIRLLNHSVVDVAGLECIVQELGFERENGYYVKNRLSPAEIKSNLQLLDEALYSNFNTGATLN